MSAGEPDRPDWLELLDHTADEGIAVRAGTREALFARLGWGMFFLITDMGRVEPRDKVLVSVEAPDVEALVVRWLSELNFLHTTRHWLFSRFDVRPMGDDRSMTAEAFGEPIDLRRHAVHTEIKAITFHGLQVRSDASGWHGRVLFDV